MRSAVSAPLQCYLQVMPDNMRPPLYYCTAAHFFFYSNSKSRQLPQRSFTIGGSEFLYIGCHSCRPTVNIRAWRSGSAKRHSHVPLLFNEYPSRFNALFSMPLHDTFFERVLINSHIECFYGESSCPLARILDDRVIRYSAIGSCRPAAICKVVKRCR